MGSHIEFWFQSPSRRGHLVALEGAITVVIGGN